MNPTVTIPDSAGLYAQTTISPNGRDDSPGQRIPAGTYRVVQRRAPVWGLQQSEGAGAKLPGDPTATYYFVPRRGLVGYLND